MNVEPWRNFGWVLKQHTQITFIWLNRYLRAIKSACYSATCICHLLHHALLSYLFIYFYFPFLDWAEKLTLNQSQTTRLTRNQGVCASKRFQAQSTCYTFTLFLIGLSSCASILKKEKHFRSPTWSSNKLLETWQKRYVHPGVGFG